MLQEQCQAPWNFLHLVNAHLICHSTPASSLVGHISLLGVDCVYMIIQIIYFIEVKATGNFCKQNTVIRS